ncbi:MAG: hypothetical protein IPM82_31925 [Saprospiraceae bacterium]|nr:hypothetical protein [Saprospiraceae bacterium]
MMENCAPRIAPIRKECSASPQLHPHPPRPSHVQGACSPPKSAPSVSRKLRKPGRGCPSRARQYYKDLGYSEDWIAKRLQSIEIRGKLTPDEWKSRDVKEGMEYAILTAEISKAVLGLPDLRPNA